jgi:Ca2+:H+ antiporter
MLISYFRKTCLLIFRQVVGFTAECLVGSINGLTSSGNISKEFVGMILLPIVGNAAGMKSFEIGTC